MKVILTPFKAFFFSFERQFGIILQYNNEYYILFEKLLKKNIVFFSYFIVCGLKHSIF